MSADVVEFTGITTLNLDPQRVLQSAIAEGLSEVVIVGFNADGSEYFSSSVSDGGDVLWHLERAKTKLLRMAD